MLVEEIDNLIQEKTNGQLKAIERSFKLRHKAVDMYGSKNPVKLRNKLQRIDKAKNSVINKLSPFNNIQPSSEAPIRHPYRLTNPAWAANE